MDRRPLAPRTFPVGANQLLLTDEDFLNGYQAGHLAYMAHGRDMQFSDTSLRRFLMAMFENMDYSEAYCFSYVVGWLVTFAGTEPRPQEIASTPKQGEP